MSKVANGRYLELYFRSVEPHVVLARTLQQLAQCGVVFGVIGNGDDDVIEHDVDVRDVAEQLVVLSLKHFRRGRNSKRQTHV